jgi:hypothetical protein
VGTTFNATLETPLDSQKSKAGDGVTAEVNEPVTYQNSLIFPKGTKISGHIVRTSSQGKADDGSGLFVQFDKAVLKDGQQVVLNAGIQALLMGLNTQAPADAGSHRELEQSAALAARVEAAAAESTSPANKIVKPATYADPAKMRVPTAPTATGGIMRNGFLTPDSRGALGQFNLNVYTPTSAGSHGTVLLSTAKRVHVDSGTRLLIVVQPPPSVSSADADGASSNAGPSEVDPNDPDSNMP